MKVYLKCAICNKDVVRTPSQHSRSISGNFYCSRSCSAKGTNPTRLRSRKTKDYASNAEQVRIHRKLLRNQVMKLYGGKCTCCGESDTRFLTLDHISNDGKEHRTKLGRGRSIYKWAIDNFSPDILQLHCWNCNLGKYHHHGVCPHKIGTEIDNA